YGIRPQCDGDARDPRRSFLAVFPNPAGDHFFVKNEADLPVNLTLFDPAGTIRWAERVPADAQKTIDLNGLPAGTWFLYSERAGRIHIQAIVHP
ncbi:MAG: T9SS C-terminal target domain-containing protein, partial [Bacteroidetes bacterium]